MTNNSAYGVYSDHAQGYDDFFRKIKVEEKEESISFNRASRLK